MRPNFIFIIFYLFLIIPYGKAQKINTDFGEISIFERLMSVYPYDSTATAVILSDDVTQTMTANHGRTSIFRHRRRIKILDAKAIDELGEITIPFFSKDRLESIGPVRAQVMQPGGIIEKVAPKDIFKEAYNEKYTLVKFAFPNVQEGSILEYQYTIESRNLFSPRSWEFCGPWPVYQSKYKFINQLPYTYNYLIEGIDYFEETVEKGNTIYSLDDMRLSVIRHKEFIAEKVPALKPAEFITCLDDYQTKIRFQLAKVDRAHFGDEAILATWDQVAKDLSENGSFGFYYQKPRFSKNLIAKAKKVINAKTDEETRVKQILDFLSQQIKPNKILGYLPDYSPDEALEEGQADIASRGLALIALLQHFDIEAYPLLSSTRQHGKLIPNHVFVDQFNYLLVGVKIGESIKAIDLKNDQLPIGWVHTNLLGRQALLLKGEKAAWVNLPRLKEESVLIAELELDKQGNLLGQIEMQRSKYATYLESKKLETQSPEKLWQARLTVNHPNTEVNDLTYDAPLDKKAPYKGSCQIHIDNAALINDDFMYLSPILQSRFMKTPFKASERNLPLDFPYGVRERNILKIKLPKGWTIEDLPTDSKMSLSDNRASFFYSVDQFEEKIVITTLFNINTTTYNPQDYKDLKELFDLAEEKLNEQIVFKKI